MGGHPDDSIAKATKEDPPGKESDAREKATTAAEKTIATKVAEKEQPSNRESTDQKHPTATGEKVITNSIGMKLALIPAGEFLMGSPDLDKDADVNEKPQHRVRIAKPFYLGVYPVTQSEYERVMGENPSWFCKSGTGKGKIGQQDTSQFPVEHVLWKSAVEFCKRLSKKENEEYRLPTEAQQEYAGRAGSTTMWCYGDKESVLGKYAWFDGNAGRRTHPVGQKKPNAWGLYDMHGNVWEWCSDWYAEDYYRISPPEDPTGAATDSGRVIRGGCWLNPAEGCRSAYRINRSPGFRAGSLGFRVTRVPADK